MSEITIVCCWNNIAQYNKLLDSIATQELDVKVLDVDNRKQVFKSCSRALNNATLSVQTKYVLYAHQDIIFSTSDTVSHILRYLNMIQDGDILGFAGANFDSPFVKTNVLVGNEKNREYGGSSRVNGIEQCDTLDECLFGGYTSYFKRARFDETICCGWHLYTVELCLRTKIYGGKVYVCDVEMFHISRGAIDSSYNDTYRKLCQKYGKYFKCLRTPCCYYSKTSYFFRNLYWLRKKLGMAIRKKGRIL